MPLTVDSTLLRQLVPKTHSCLQVLNNAQLGVLQNALFIIQLFIYSINYLLHQVNRHKTLKDDY